MTTAAKQKLRLKKANGWFPAGEGFLEAMTILSDGAFRLFVFLCINADRRTATYCAAYRRLAPAIGRSRHTVEAYAAELQAKGLCSVLPSRIPYVGTTFRICDQYWPYATDGTGADPANAYVDSIRNTFVSLGCTTGRFGPSEQRQALEFEKRGIALDVLTDAMFLAACRKYVAWLNNGPSQPIASIRYFETVVEEVQERPFPPGYRDYIRFEVRKLARLWAESPKRPMGPLEQTVERSGRERRDDGDAIPSAVSKKTSTCRSEIAMRNRNR